MKRKVAIWGLCTLALAVSVAVVVEALAAPQLIRQEGTLTDAYGNPIPDQTVSMRFRICDAKTGGTALWTEVQQVDVKSGVYSVLLGSATPFPATLFPKTNPRWLEIKVGTSAPLPRQRVVSVPYALNADTLDALDSTKFSRSTHTHAVSSLTGTAIDTQIPAAITRDTELTTGLATKANTAHTHDDRYYTKAEVNALETRIASLEAAMAQLQTLLQNVTRNGNDITFSGVNVRVVSGSGTTSGTVNGYGNLIIGYNEPRGSGNVRSGSHNLIVGTRHNYSSYGGIVVGTENTISREFASVSGGYGNTASGEAASVSGGMHNTASGSKATVSGGYGNTASQIYASVSGGEHNTASGGSSSISGGLYNQALGDFSFVGGGGHRNAAFGNKAYANLSAILGGANNVAGVQGAADQGELSSVTGGDTNVASGWASSVSGGKHNTASNSASSVSGGAYRTVSDEDGWGAGALWQDN